MSLCKGCPYLEFFCSVFSSIWTKNGDLLRKSPYSVQRRVNTEQKNSEYRHFSRSVLYYRSLDPRYVLLSSVSNIQRFNQVSAFIKKLMKKTDMRTNMWSTSFTISESLSKIKSFPKRQSYQTNKKNSIESFVQGVFVNPVP